MSIYLFQGNLRSNDIKACISDFRSSELWSLLEKYLHTTDGAAIYRRFRETVQDQCSRHMIELRGLADGAGVHFDDVSNTAVNYAGFCLFFVFVVVFFCCLRKLIYP